MKIASCLCLYLVLCLAMRASVDMSDVVRFERQLRSFGRTGIPHANRNALNTGAFTTQKVARAELDRRFVIKNSWTGRSILVDKARGMNVDRQEARVGSVQKYMETQEFGGTETSDGKRGVAIPTSYAAGQGVGGKQTKMVRKDFRLANIQMRKTRKRGKNRKQQNIIAIAESIKAKRKFVYLNLGRRKGIFRVVAGRSRNAGRRRSGAKIRMVHDLTKKTIAISPHPWLRPSVEKVRPAMQLIYFKALQKQSAKHFKRGR